MSPLKNQLSDEDTVSVATAHIEAQETALVQPLREYLERHGCSVSTNVDGATSYMYLLCVGEWDFVKAFYARKKFNAQKKLAIIYGEGAERPLTVSDDSVKVFLIDPKPLTDTLTKEIFSFFFTSRATSKDARKEPIADKRPSVMSTESSREPSKTSENEASVDTIRIHDTIRQIFAPKSTAHTGSILLSTIRSKPAVRWIALVILVLFIPVIAYIITISMGAGLLALSGKSLMSGSIPWTRTVLRYAESNISSAQTLLHLGSPMLQLTGLGGIATDEDRLLEMFQDVSKAEEGVLTIYESSKEVAAGVLFPQGSSEAVNASDVRALTTEVSRVSQHLSLVQAELDSLTASRRFPFQSGFIQRLGQRGLAALGQVRTQIGYTEKLLTLYPEMAGFRRKQTYLVLLQNSMELRPTGGFIGSLLLVTFVDGKVDDMHVVDVYTADGQLKGHIDPPTPIKEIIGQEHWYLRDSNWDPDFSVSGKQAAWFYEKEMGQSVDGVIAISLPMVTDLLRALGPVELPDFNERISEGNFFAKSLLYTQTDFFPGSTQKKDFLGALTNALLLRITGDRTISAAPLLKIMTMAIQARDIQFYFTEANLQRLVSQWEWDGALHTDSCEIVSKDMPCIADGIGVVEANLGINKVNYFVTHEALSSITLADDGLIRQSMAIKVKNTTPSQIPEGGGAYQVYMRLYYSQGTNINLVKLDGTDVPQRNIKSVVPPPAPYYVVDASGSATVLQVPFSVLPRQEHELIVETTRASPTFAGSSSYEYTIRKQAGIETYPWHVVVQYPSSWSAIAQSGVAKPGRLEYNTDLAKDASFRVVFQKSL